MVTCVSSGYGKRSSRITLGMVKNGFRLVHDPVLSIRRGRPERREWNIMRQVIFQSCNIKGMLNLSRLRY